MALERRDARQRRCAGAARGGNLDEGAATQRFRNVQRAHRVDSSLAVRENIAFLAFTARFL
jgi:hypothetical protein